MQTLPDRPCRPGGVLIIGINPPPVSVAAGHYYQGRNGQRMWERLKSIGLLAPDHDGWEDDAFVATGNGLTDLIKRPTARAKGIPKAELAEGIDALRAKIRDWKPRLLLFSYAPPAELLFGKSFPPGRCDDFEGAMTFRLAGPFAAGETSKKICDQLRLLLGTPQLSKSTAPAIVEKKMISNCAMSVSSLSGDAQTQPITQKDLEAGRIRLKHAVKPLLEGRGSRFLIKLRGRLVEVAYNARDNEGGRSAYLKVPKRDLQHIEPDDKLSATIYGDGTIRFD